MAAHGGATAALMGRALMAHLVETVAKQLLQDQQGWPEELKDKHRAQALEIVRAVERAGFRISRK